MGYRSVVGISLLNKYVDDFEKLIVELDPDLLSGSEKTVKETYTIYYWEWIKWYDFDDPIKSIMNFINPIIDLDECQYIRIGEDYSDIETYGNCDLGLSLVRQIDFN